MKILLVDFNDSFTAILRQTIENSGENVQVDVTNINSLPSYPEISNNNGLVLGPGPGHVNEYPSAFDLLDYFEDKKPVLGICLGLQIMAVKYGGELFNLNKVYHGKKSKIVHYGNSVLFSGIEKEFYAGLYHSWAVKKTGNNLEVTSVREEDNVIMSLKHSQFLVEGVQFHPESYMTPFGHKMIGNWLKVLAGR